MMSTRFSPGLLSATLAALLLFGSTDAQAGASNKSGNPYGNGTFFPDSGNFSAVLRGSNGFLGTVQFSTGTNSTNSGVATIYAEGNQFVGTAVGTIDSSANVIQATYSTVAGSSYTVLPTLSSTPVTGTNFNTVGFSYQSGLTNFSSSNSCVGAFTANINNSYPNQVFSGTGQATIKYSTVTATLVPERGVIASAYYNYSATNVVISSQYSVTGSRLNN